jgi:RES domain-containing protein
MSLTAAELAGIDEWAGRAKPLSGVWFRSVPARWMDPAHVLNGEGTFVHGGRFAAPGTLAVFLSATDQLATAEVTMRKSRLGGSALITVDKYPRMVFGVEVSLERVLAFSKRSMPKALHSLHGPCLDKDSLAPSFGIGSELLRRSIQALRFPSVTGRGPNLVIYNRHCDPSSLKLVNLSELMAKIRAIAGAP